MVRKQNKITVIMLTMLMLSISIQAKAESNRGKEYKQFLDNKISRGVNIEEFKRFDSVNKTRVAKLNDLINTVDTSYQTTQSSSINILGAFQQDRANSQMSAERQMAVSKKRRESAASRATGFNYVANTDGSKTTFKDGLVDKIENERVLDEYGNVSLKDTYNFKYNNNRLMTSYEADQTDELGNLTHIVFEGAQYSAGSLFYANNYGDNQTNAYKTMIAYQRTETDHAGNTRRTNYTATDYKGKYVRTAKTQIHDSVYGDTSFTRSDITYKDGKANQIDSYIEKGIGADGRPYKKERLYTNYNNKDQITGYCEQTTLYDYDSESVINTTTTTASFDYLKSHNKFGRDVEEDPNKLTQSVITTMSVSSNGAKRNETTITNYQYDKEQNLIAASAQSEFTGQEAKWWQYTDTEGHTLSRTEDKAGDAIYIYLDDNDNEIVVFEDQVTATLKEGNYYQGISDTEYEIMVGQPVKKNVYTNTSFYGHNLSPEELVKVETSNITYSNGLVNNFRKVLNSYEKKTITDPLRDPENSHTTTKHIYTTYYYDNNGSLINASGEGTAHGWNYQDIKGWHREYDSTIIEEYVVILGKAMKIDYHEDIDFIKK